MDKRDAEIRRDEGSPAAEFDVISIANVRNMRRHGCVRSDLVALHECEKLVLFQVRRRRGEAFVEADPLERSALAFRQRRQLTLLHSLRRNELRKSSVGDA